MKKTKILTKGISFALSFAMLPSLVVVPVMADATQEISAPQTAETKVLCNIESTFSVTLPKEISLSGVTKTADYNIFAELDLTAAEYLKVEPDETVTLSQVNKDDRIADIVQETNYLSNTLKTTTGQISAPKDIGSGHWEGIFDFSVTVTEDIKNFVTIKELEKYYSSLNTSQRTVLPNYDYIQPWLAGSYSFYELQSYIQNLKAVGYKGAILQYSMEYNLDDSGNIQTSSLYYDSQLQDVSNLPDYAYKKDFLDNLLKAADAANFDIYVGIPYAKDWFENKYATNDSWTDTVNTFSTNTINEIYQKYNKYNSFKGWYWSYEIYSNTDGYFDQWSGMLNNVIGEIDKLHDSRPLMISSFVSALYDIDNATVKGYWDDFLSKTNFRSGDIINMQDSIGAIDIPVEKIYGQINAVKDSIATSNKGIEFWLNVENYTKSKNEFVPSSLDRCELQYKIASTITDKLSSFSYSHYILGRNEAEYIQRFISQNDKIVVLSTSLLSEEEYNTYKNQIPSVSFDYWTGSPCPWAAGYGRVVTTSGDVVDDAVFDEYKSVRPVLRLDNSSLKAGDVFEKAGYTWTVISEDLAICNQSIGTCAFNKNSSAQDSNKYESSDIKTFIDNWAKEHSL